MTNQKDKLLDNQQQFLPEQSIQSFHALQYYKQQPYRWIVLIVYILAAISNSLPTQTFSSINSTVQQAFGYSPIVVTLFTLIFPISHPLFAVPANWILDRFGMYVGCVTGGCLLIAGVWLRTLIQQNNPTWCLIGSILSAIGNVFVLNSPSILANNWFKPSSIPTVITITILSNLISITLGSTLPGLFVGSKQFNDDTQKRQAIQNFLRVEAYFITAAFVLMFAFLRNRPQIPPSPAAQKQAQSRQDYKQSIKKLFTNKQYLLIIPLISFTYGIMISYIANLQQAVKDIGYQKPSLIASYFGLSAMISGIFGSFFFSFMIKKTLQYKKIMIICFGCCASLFVVLQFILLQNYSQIWPLVLTAALTGFFFIPSTSILMSYSSQVVYPLGQGSATGYLFAFSQSFGFVIGLVSAYILDSFNEETRSFSTVYAFMGVNGGFLVLAFACSFLTNNVLNRTRFHNRISQALSNRNSTYDQIQNPKNN